MPGSSLRDPSPPSSSTGRKGGRKQKQRLTQAASDAGSKKKDKNVKDGGGVVAAVTRQATKFSYVSTRFYMFVIAGLASTSVTVCTGWLPSSLS